MCFLDLINYYRDLYVGVPEFFSQLTPKTEIENACIDCADLLKCTQIHDAYDLKPNWRNISSRSYL